MFQFKDIIQMDYETCKRMISAINTHQSAFVLKVSKEQSALELHVGDEVVEHFSFSVEPWMEPGNE